MADCHEKKRSHRRAKNRAAFRSPVSEIILFFLAVLIRFRPAGRFRLVRDQRDAFSPSAADLIQGWQQIFYGSMLKCGKEKNRAAFRSPGLGTLFLRKSVRERYCRKFFCNGI